MSKHKKKQQKQIKNLSLKERLVKHWDNSNWDLFAALFLRDREASMRTPLAVRWHDALYNSLTQALFADKNPESAEATLGIINAERSASGISALLEDCASVASDFLTAYKNAFIKELSPLKDERGLPSVYAGLRKGLAVFVSSRGKEPKTRKSGAAALAEKFGTQYAKLGRAKTIMPYTTWLKIAEQLEDMAKGTENERVFRAVRAIAALVRELFLAGRGENSLRKPELLSGSKLFLSVPNGQTAPAVKALWNSFCSAGEQKYGAEWGEAARVAQLAFMEDENQRGLKAQYNKLIRSEALTSGRFGKDAAKLALSLIKSSSSWTEQELYILNTVFVSFFSGGDVSELLKAFNVLTRIGRKWRPEAPWTKGTQKGFDRLLYNCTIEAISGEVQVPCEAVSPYSLVMLALQDGRYLKEIEKTVPHRLPVRLDEDDLDGLVYYLAEELPRNNIVNVLNALTGQDGTTAVMTRLARSVIERSVAAIYKDKPMAELPWTDFCAKGISEEIAAQLPSDDLMGCFCRLCSGMPPYHISGDPAKTEAFFSALPSEKDDQSADLFLNFLLVWPDVAPPFLVRLLEKSNLFLDKWTISKWGDGDAWLTLAARIEKMPNKANREAAALGILKLTGWRKGKKANASFKKAMELLERLRNVKGRQRSKCSCHQNP